MARESAPKMTRVQEREPEIVRVEPDQWKVIEGNDIGETTRLGPCVGVVIYDREKHESLLGHFVDPRMGEFQDMLSEARSRISIQDSEVSVGGGGPTPGMDNVEVEEIKNIRLFVKKQLEQNGFQHPHIQFEDDSSTSVVLRVDNGTGAVTYDTESIE